MGLFDNLTQLPSRVKGFLDSGGVSATLNAMNDFQTKKTGKPLFQAPPPNNPPVQAPAPVQTPYQQTTQKSFPGLYTSTGAPKYDTMSAPALSSQIDDFLAKAQTSSNQNFYKTHSVTELPPVVSSAPPELSQTPKSPDQMFWEMSNPSTPNRTPAIQQSYAPTRSPDQQDLSSHIQQYIQENGDTQNATILGQNRENDISKLDPLSGHIQRFLDSASDTARDNVQAFGTGVLKGATGMDSGVPVANGILPTISNAVGNLAGFGAGLATVGELGIGARAGEAGAGALTSKLVESGATGALPRLAVGATSNMIGQGIDFGLLGQAKSFLAGDNLSQHLAKLKDDVFQGIGWGAFGSFTHGLSPATGAAATATAMTAYGVINGEDPKKALIDGVLVGGLHLLGANPYTMNVPEVMDQARQLLGVSDHATPQEVNDAFVQRTSGIDKNSADYQKLEFAHTSLLFPEKLMTLKPKIEAWDRNFVGNKGQGAAPEMQPDGSKKLPWEDLIPSDTSQKAGSPVVNAPTETPEALQNLRDEYDLYRHTIQDKVVSQIQDEFGIAEQGRKIFDRSGVHLEVNTLGGSFPRWVPAEFRSHAIMDPVLQHILDGTEPAARSTKQIELKKIIEDMIDRRMQQDPSHGYYQEMKDHIDQEEVAHANTPEYKASREKQIQQFTAPAPAAIPGDVSTLPAEAQNIHRSTIENMVDLANKKEGLGMKLKRYLAPFRYLDTTTRGIYQKWTADNAVGYQKANEDLQKIQVPNKEGLDVINKYQAGVDTPYNAQIKKAFDELYQESNEKGIDVQYTKNYLPQMYKDSRSEVMDAVTKMMIDKGVDKNIIEGYLNGQTNLPDEISNATRMTPHFTYEKVFPDYKTAMDYGLTPKYTNPAQLLAASRMDLEKTIADRNFVNNLVFTGKIRESAEGADIPRGWLAVNQSLGGPRMYAEPHTATALNGIFRDNNNLSLGDAITKGVSYVNGTIQMLETAAGVPGTTINFFALGKLNRMLTEGDIGAVKSMLRANSNSATAKYFVENAPVIMEMAKNNFPLTGRQGNFKDAFDNTADTFKRTLQTKGIFDAMSEGAKKGIKAVLGSFDGKTFDNLMPTIYVEIYKQGLKLAESKGVENPGAFAAELLRHDQGIAENMGRSQGAKDAVGSLFFAAPYREATLGTLWNTAKSMTTSIKDPTYALNRRLFAGMLIAYSAYNALNYKLNGHGMSDNPPGREFALRIPMKDGTVAYIEYMPSFMAFPRNIGEGVISLKRGDWDTAKQKFSSIFGAGDQMAYEMLSNRDYFGKEIYKSTDPWQKQAGGVGRYLLGHTHPYVQEAVNQVEEKKPLYQSLITAGELPVKFSTDQKEKANRYYDAKTAKTTETSKAENDFAPTFDHIQKVKVEQGQNAADSLYFQLSASDRAIYDKMKTADKSKGTVTKETSIIDKALEIKRVKAEQGQAAADELYYALPWDERLLYDKIKNQIAVPQ